MERAFLVLFRYLAPPLLLKLRRVCRAWARELERDLYWMAHKRRVCARLPTMAGVFDGASGGRPLWWVYAKLVALRGPEMWSIMDGLLRESLIWSAHGRPDLIQSVKRSPKNHCVVTYHCGCGRAYLPYQFQTIEKCMLSLLRHPCDMHLNAFTFEFTDTERRCTETAFYGPFRDILCGRVPIYCDSSGQRNLSCRRANYMCFEV